MKVYKGFTASPGLVLGQVSRLDRPPLVFGEGPFHPEQEKQALEDAIKVAQQELDVMAGRAKLFYLRGRTGKAAKVKSDI